MTTNKPATKAEIQAAVDKLEKELAPLKAMLAAINQSELEERSRFKVGEIITDGRLKGRVLRVLARFGGAYEVQIIRKDGSEGGTRRFYEWSPLKKISDAPTINQKTKGSES
jgi:hypothetical protein